MGLAFPFPFPSLVGMVCLHPFFHEHSFLPRFSPSALVPYSREDRRDLSSADALVILSFGLQQKPHPQVVLLRVSSSPMASLSDDIMKGCGPCYFHGSCSPGEFTAVRLGKVLHPVCSGAKSLPQSFITQGMGNSKSFHTQPIYHLGPFISISFCRAFIQR